MFVEGDLGKGAVELASLFVSSIPRSTIAQDLGFIGAGKFLEALLVRYLLNFWRFFYATLE